MLSVCLQLCKILKIIMIISSQTMTKRKCCDTRLTHTVRPYHAGFLSYLLENRLLQRFYVKLYTSFNILVSFLCYTYKLFDRFNDWWSFSLSFNRKHKVRTIPVVSANSLEPWLKFGRLLFLWLHIYCKNIYTRILKQCVEM